MLRRLVAPVIAELRAGGAESLRTIAAGLNARGIPTARGAGQWSAAQGHAMPTYTRAGVTTAVVAAAVVALLIGIALGSGSSGLHNWQTLLAAIVALGGGAFAYYGVVARLKADWIVREEERIERELPGVMDAIVMVEPIIVGKDWFSRTARDWEEVLENAGLDLSHGFPSLQDVRKLLPNTDPSVVNDVFRAIHKMIEVNQDLKIEESKEEEDALSLTRLQHRVALEAQKLSKLQLILHERREFLKKRRIRVRAKIDRMIEVE